MKYLFLIFLISNFITTNKLIPPPGTIQLEENLFIDKEYISVQSWKEYILIKERNSEKVFYPDTSYMINKENYFNSGKFDAEPIMKISFEAMQDYITWRTEFINSGLDNFSLKNKCKPKFYLKNYKKDIHVKYKLCQKDDFLAAKERGLIDKFEVNENFTNETWIDSSTFRCTAVFISKE